MTPQGEQKLTSKEVQIANRLRFLRPNFTTREFHTRELLICLLTTWHHGRVCTRYQGRILPLLSLPNLPNLQGPSNQLIPPSLDNHFVNENEDV